MKKVKLFSLGLLALLFAGAFIACINLSFASESVITANDPNGTPDAGATIGANQPSANAYNSAVGDNYKAPSTFYLTKIQVWLYRDNSPDGKVYCSLTGVTSQAGTSAPNMTDKKETSYTFMPMMNITLNAYQINTFYFSGNYQLTANTYYGVVVWADNGTNLGATNRLYTGQKGSQADLGTYFYYTNGAWSSSTSYDMSIRIYGDVSPPVTPTPSPSPAPYTYTYSITGPTAVTYAGTSPVIASNITQLSQYTYWGQLNNGPTGNFSVYKTLASTNSTDVAQALTNGTLTFNYTRAFNFNIMGPPGPWFYFTPEYVAGSINTFQGYRVNGTVDGSAFTFSSDVVINATEPSYYFKCYISGGIYSDHLMPPAPDQLGFSYGVSYTIQGLVYHGSLLNGTGNFTTYSTGFSQDPDIVNTGTYSQVANGFITNGLFSFSITRQEMTPYWEGYRVSMVLDGGQTYTVTYEFYLTPGNWFITPGPGGQGIDTPGTNSLILNLINLIVLIVIIGGPAILLGVKAGIPGLLVGASLGLGAGVIAGLVPMWFIFLTGLGMVCALFVWRGAGPSG